MIFREASIKDIPGMHKVRMSVNENRLSNPDLVKESDYSEFILTKGKGWICELDKQIAGFAIVDLRSYNVWALFIDPLHERKGIGKELHSLMLAWYFRNTSQTLWLSTAPGTRAESFYKKAGWISTGLLTSGEIKFEMTSLRWKELQS